MTENSRKPTVVVMGSGIAGLVTAYELSKRGCAVTLVEAAPMLGGRTSTYVDEKGRTVDTGLHVIADHYINLAEVLAQVGASKKIRWVGKHTYLRQGREAIRWQFSPYSAPFHFAGPIRDLPIAARTRLALGRTSLEIMSYAQRDLHELDDITYSEWHNQRGLGEGFVLDLAEAAADASSFLTVKQAAARPILSWMKYLFRNRFASDVGLFQGSLQECLVDPLANATRAQGGIIRTNVAVRELVTDGKRITAARLARTNERRPCNRADGKIEVAADSSEFIDADFFVSALSVQGLRALLGQNLAEETGLISVGKIPTTPALSVILWLDRKITPVPEGAPLTTGCAMRNFVDMESLGRPGASGSAYQFIVTRADERMDDPAETIAADIFRDLKQLWPGAQDAKLADFAVERIGAAMFAAVPGVHKLRPEVQTRLSNFFLAGDFTKHDLNASMEGAAYSGRRAAEAVLAALGRRQVIIRALPEAAVVEKLSQVRVALRSQARAFRQQRSRRAATR